MEQLYLQLQWLPQPPQEFSEKLKAVGSDAASPGPELRALASHALNLNQLTKLAKVVTKARSERRPLDPLVPFRLALVSNSTTDMMVPALVGSGLRHGLALDIIHPPYDQVAQAVLAPDSVVNVSKPDAVLFAIDYRALPLKLSLANAEGASAVVKGVINYLEALRAGVKANSNAICIFQTFPAPVEPLFGSLDCSIPGTMKSLLREINHELSQIVPSGGDVLLDIAGLAETVGLATWHNPQLWNMAKLPFSDELIPLYAEHVARTIAAVRGKSRKALILDLDNTVWGGVIGDDGLEGIQIAQGDARGEAHLAVQSLALDLRNRGIVLAVSSKNTDEIARQPFEKHPDMLLKLDHIAVFQANWNDKATNIQAIADELSLGLDAMVLLDDNPVERGLVRKLLPQVAVPELPEDPAWYARTLSAAGYFEAATFAAEDLKRASFYQDNARRASLQTLASGVDAYLASLDLTITFSPFDSTGRARIVQLINKSNQYNLTTRRYNDAEVAAAEHDPFVFTLQVRLKDIFGDNGMISIVICRPSGDRAWDIDTWLMSCRVLGRKVEHMVLREILKHARAADVFKLNGTYVPSSRNGLVVDHYATLGFTKVHEDESGLTSWELFVEAADPEIAPMEVVELGFEDKDATPV
jgi:FkbH-like protein